MLNNFLSIQDGHLFEVGANSIARLGTYSNKYRKIPKISPMAYIFQRPFLRGLFLGQAYIRRGLSTEGNLHLKIDWSSLIVGG